MYLRVIILGGDVYEEFGRRQRLDDNGKSDEDVTRFFLYIFDVFCQKRRFVLHICVGFLYYFCFFYQMLFVSYFNTTNYSCEIQI